MGIVGIIFIDIDVYRILYIYQCEKISSTSKSQYIEY